MAANLDCPVSPEFTKEEIDAYTPSNEDEASLNDSTCLAAAACAS